MTTGRIALLSVLVLLLHLVCAKESISQAIECEEGDEACPACIDLDTDCMPLVEDNDCLEITSLHGEKSAEHRAVFALMKRKKMIR